jgi:hypothetical protein
MSYVAVGALTRVSTINAPAVPVSNPSAGQASSFKTRMTTYSAPPPPPAAAPTNQVEFGVPMQKTVQAPQATVQQVVPVPQAVLQQAVPVAEASVQKVPSLPVQPTVTPPPSSWSPLQAPVKVEVPAPAPKLSPISLGLQYALIPPPAAPAAPAAPRAARRPAPAPAARPSAGSWLSRPAAPLVPPAVMSYLPGASWSAAPAPVITNTQQVTLPPSVREPSEAPAGMSKRDWMIAGLIGLVAVGAAAVYVKQKKG